MSVVIPAYRARATLADCVASVLAQRVADADGPFEVVVVASGDEPPPPLPDDPRLRVERVPGRLGAAAARNRGAAVSRGSLLAFTDADVVAPPGWLAAIVGASAAAGHRVVVAGSVANGTPGSIAGTAEHLVQFSSLAPTAEAPGHGATCNLLVPRPLWDELGPFPEDMGGGEDTLLTMAAARTGRFEFLAGAPVVHRNRTSLRSVLTHQRAFGAFTAHLAERCPDLPHRRLLRSPALVPLAVGGRAVAVVGRARASLGSTPVGRRLPALGVAALAVVAWGAGLLAELRAMRRGPAAG